MCANRCSHLKKSSLACFCSDSDHSLRPWRSKASKTHPFCAGNLVSAAVLVRWTTGGTWLVGTICPMTILVGMSMAWVLRLCRQTCTLEEPGCSSPSASSGYHCCWQLGTKCQLHEDMYSHTVSLDTGVCPYIDGAKWGYGDFLCGANQTFDVIESELLHLHQCHLVERSLLPLL